jgi:hypothetical protein
MFTVCIPVKKGFRFEAVLVASQQLLLMGSQLEQFQAAK